MKWKKATYAIRYWAVWIASVSTVLSDGCWVEAEVSILKACSSLRHDKLLRTCHSLHIMSPLQLSPTRMSVESVGNSSKQDTYTAHPDISEVSTRSFDWSVVDPLPKIRTRFPMSNDLTLAPDFRYACNTLLLCTRSMKSMFGTIWPFTWVD